MVDSKDIGMIDNTVNKESEKINSERKILCEEELRVT